MFILAIKSTPEGFEIQRKEVSSSIIDGLYLSKSLYLTEHVFKEIISHISSELFEIVSMSTHKDNYNIIYKPIKNIIFGDKP